MKLLTDTDVIVVSSGYQTKTFEMGLALKCVNKSTVYLPKNKYISDFHAFGGSVSVRIKRRRAAT